jgi:hypothetical protein
MFTCGRIEALAVVRALGAKQCVYTSPGRSWPRFCDCKYGGDKLDFGGERGNGCPELRTLTLALERMTDAEFEALLKLPPPTSPEGT